MFFRQKPSTTGSKTDLPVTSKILSLISDEPVRKMELIGTVLYFSKKTKNVSEIKRLVNTVKPQFSDADIEEAVRVLREKRIIRG